MSDGAYSSGLAGLGQQLDGELIVEYAATSPSVDALKLALRRLGRIADAIQVDGAR